MVNIPFKLVFKDDRYVGLSLWTRIRIFIWLRRCERMLRTSLKNVEIRYDSVSAELKIYPKEKTNDFQKLHHLRP